MRIVLRSLTPKALKCVLHHILGVPTVTKHPACHPEKHRTPHAIQISECGNLGFGHAPNENGGFASRVFTKPTGQRVNGTQISFHHDG
jgi:hypothetical protein